MIEKRILLVGDGNHQFIFNYVIWLKKASDEKFTIDILSLSPVKENNKSYYGEIYRINTDSPTFKFLSEIKGLRRYYRFFLYKKLLRSLHSYDFIHFHFISVDSTFLINEFKNATNSKIISSIWGSDLYKIKPSNEENFLKACSKSDYITFTNKESLDFFRSKYNWQNRVGGSHPAGP